MKFTDKLEDTLFGKIIFKCGGHHTYSKRAEKEVNFKLHEHLDEQIQETVFRELLEQDLECKDIMLSIGKIEDEHVDEFTKRKELEVFAVDMSQALGELRALYRERKLDSTPALRKLLACYSLRKTRCMEG